MQQEGIGEVWKKEKERERRGKDEARRRKVGRDDDGSNRSRLGGAYVVVETRSASPDLCFSSRRVV